MFFFFHFSNQTSYGSEFQFSLFCHEHESKYNLRDCCKNLGQKRNETKISSKPCESIVKKRSRKRRAQYTNKRKRKTADYHNIKVNKAGSGNCNPIQIRSGKWVTFHPSCSYCNFLLLKKIKNPKHSYLHPALKLHGLQAQLS